MASSRHVGHAGPCRSGRCASARHQGERTSTSRQTCCPLRFPRCAGSSGVSSGQGRPIPVAFSLGRTGDDDTSSAPDDHTGPAEPELINPGCSTSSPRMRNAQHTNNFDLIRLLAALQVLYVHAVGWLKLPNIPFPWRWPLALFPGVAVFFVISGFLVTRSFLDSRSGTLGYFTRRALRIYPGLWVHFVVILLMLTIAGALPLPQLGGKAFWGWVGVAFTMGSDFCPTSSETFMAGSPSTTQA